MRSVFITSWLHSEASSFFIFQQLHVDFEDDCGPGSESPKDEKKMTEQALLEAGTTPTASIVSQTDRVLLEFLLQFLDIS